MTNVRNIKIFPVGGWKEGVGKIKQTELLLKLANELERYGFKIEIDYKEEKIRMR